VHTAGLRSRTPNEISCEFQDRAYRPDPFASTTDLKISPNYKNTKYVAPQSFRTRTNRIRVMNSNNLHFDTNSN
ncbi:hypothetical protein PanWU01x14_273080, partial [Parasponia andersonii]